MSVFLLVGNALLLGVGIVHQLEWCTAISALGFVFYSALITRDLWMMYNSLNSIQDYCSWCRPEFSTSIGRNAATSLERIYFEREAITNELEYRRSQTEFSNIPPLDQLLCETTASFIVILPAIDSINVIGPTEERQLVLRYFERIRCAALGPSFELRQIHADTLTRLGLDQSYTVDAVFAWLPGETKVAFLYGEKPVSQYELERLQPLVQRTIRRIESEQNYADAVKHGADLEVLQRQRAEAVSQITHDIRSPLTSVQAALTALRYEGADKVLVDAALRSLDSAAELVETMLDYALSSVGFLQAQKTDFELCSFTHDIVNSYSSQAQSKGISLEFRGDSVRILADHKQLRRVIENLLSNAIKFTKTGGVSVTVRNHVDGANLTVSDTGRGIAIENLKGLFRPFERFGARDTPGTGLGLTVVKKLVELQNGSVQVRSKLNAGTEFIITLPVSEVCTKLNELAATA